MMTAIQFNAFITIEKYTSPNTAAASPGLPRLLATKHPPSDV